MGTQRVVRALSRRSAWVRGSETTGAGGTQSRGSPYDGRTPAVGPPDPITSPLPDGAADEVLGAGSALGIVVGARSGGGGALRFASGRPSPPLRPGVVTGPAFGSAMKLMCSTFGWLP